jgi:hypothetical protein
MENKTMTKQSSLISDHDTPPHFFKCSESEVSAYERGWAIGNVHSRSDENPFPAYSVEAKAFEHGYMDGQKC